MRRERGDVDDDLAVVGRAVVARVRAALDALLEVASLHARAALEVARTWSRPATIRPARAPPSIDMLQTVMRPSIESARIASPVYSTTWPVTPAVPIWPIRPRIRSFATTPRPGWPSKRTRSVCGRALRQRLRGQHVLDLAGADAERERAERAVRGGVRVAADDRHAGLRDAELGADHVDDALAAVAEAVAAGRRTPRSCARAPRAAARERSSSMPRSRPMVGTLWSAVARVRSGRRTRRPASAEALERLRARHLVDEVQVDEEQVVADHVVVPDLLERGLGH